jgi:hypothetical protein
MYRAKWMIIHNLDPTKPYVIDVYVKELAAKIRMPEEFVWQTLYEAALHDKSRPYVGLFCRSFTWLIKNVFGEEIFEETLRAADERLDKIRDEVFEALTGALGGNQDPENDRSKAN